MFNLFGNNTTPAEQQARAQRIAALRATQQARAYGANPIFTGNPHGDYAYQPTHTNFWDQVRQVFDPSNTASITRAFTNPAILRSETPAVRPQMAAAEQNRNRKRMAEGQPRQQAATPSWVNRIRY